DRDFATEPRVLGEVHDAHAALAEDFEQAIRSEHATDAALGRRLRARGRVAGWRGLTLQAQRPVAAARTATLDAGAHDEALVHQFVRPASPDGTGACACTTLGRSGTTCATASSPPANRNTSPTE